jgi:hypothetical protein
MLEAAPGDESYSIAASWHSASKPQNGIKIHTRIMIMGLWP